MNNNNVTSYTTAHRFIPAVMFESNVTPLDPGKSSMPNVPKLKQWNYDTSSNTSHNFKFSNLALPQRPTQMHLKEMSYIMPQWEKYWLNPPKPMNLPQTEYNDKHIQPKLMSNFKQMETPMACVRPKLVAYEKNLIMQTPKVSEMGVVRKMDPYTTTQKLAYIQINLIAAKQINAMHPKQNKIMSEYESFYSEPIFNQKNKIRVQPNTLKFVPHNGLRSETSASYKKPINTLSKFNSNVEMPLSISKNPTLAQLLSVPGMYTSEYSKIGNVYKK